MRVAAAGRLARAGAPWPLRRRTILCVREERSPRVHAECCETHCVGRMVNISQLCTSLGGTCERALVPLWAQQCGAACRQENIIPTFFGADLTCCVSLHVLFLACAATCTELLTTSAGSWQVQHSCHEKSFWPPFVV